MFIERGDIMKTSYTYTGFKSTEVCRLSTFQYHDRLRSVYAYTGDYTNCIKLTVSNLPKYAKNIMKTWKSRTIDYYHEGVYKYTCIEYNKYYRSDSFIRKDY